jgi:hypothetical protein
MRQCIATLTFRTCQLKLDPRDPWPKGCRLETALDCLERAAALGASNKRMWESNKGFENIRDNPRFKALLERI